MKISPIRPAMLALLLQAAVFGQPYTLSIPIRAVAVDSTKPIPNTWVATESGIFRSTPASPDWRNVYVRPAGQAQPAVRFIHIEKANPLAIYLVSNLDSGGILKSGDGGVTWGQANTGLPAVGNIDAFIDLPSAPFTFYALVGDRIYKSTDAARSWTLRSNSLPRNATVLEVDRADPSRMFAAAANGVYRSLNEGTTWALGDRTLNLKAAASVASILVDPSDPKIIHLAARGPKDTGAGFYRSIDGGDRFDAVPHAVPPDRSTLPNRLVSDPTGRAVYAGADENGITYFTVDKGRSWGAYLLNGTGASTIAIDPSDPKLVFVGTGRGVYGTNNDGARWDSKIGPAKPTLSLPPLPLDFVLPAGAQGRLQLPLRVVETSQWILPLSAAAESASWFALEGVTVNTPASPVVTVNTRGLERGEYTGFVRVDSQFAANSPLRVPVKLTVAGPSSVARSYRISTIAGNGQRGNFGDNQAALRATFTDLDSLAMDRDGNLFVSDPASSVVRRIGTDGVITRYAGNGRRGDNGDGGSALLAQIDTPTGLALDAAGNLYIADSGSGKIRRVNREGNISTFANGLGPCRGIAVDSAGNVYLTVPAAHVVVRITPAGQIGLFAGAVAVGGFRGDGGAPGAALLSGPLDVYVDARDRVYIADSGNHRIRRVVNGVITTVAGSGNNGFQGDGLDATKVALSFPSSVAADAAGNIYVGDAENHRLRLVSPAGEIRTLAGTGERGFSGDNGPAVAAKIAGPQDVAIDASGAILSVEAGNVRIRRLVPPPAAVLPVVSEGPVNWADDSARLSPGLIFRLRGTDLALEAASRPDAPWPVDLGGAQVTLNGQLVPLAQVSPTEITGLLPFGAALGAGTLTVLRDEIPSRDVAVTLEPAAPGILRAEPGRALAANENGSANSATAPAGPESLLTVYFTGIGLTENPPVGGAAAGEESKALLPVLVHFGELTLEPVRARLTPGRAGIAEAQFRIPVSDAGDYRVAVRVGDVVSAGATVSVGVVE